MGRRRRKGGGRDGEAERPRAGRFEHRPFSGLDWGSLSSGGGSEQRADERREEERPPPAEPRAEDERAFLDLVGDVVPIGDDRETVPRRPAARTPLAKRSDDDLVMMELDELVRGRVPFDFADTDEYLEASVEGLDPRIVRRLRRGDYSVQAHLDLHGLDRREARDKVARFLLGARAEGLRCVLVVHGRGKGSEDNIPVLKQKLSAWLTRGAIGRQVLAFTSARPCDGGTGAVYVLLRA